MMMANDAYYDGFTQNDLDFRMQKTGASMEEYKAFAKEQVIDFTDEQKKIIDEHMGRIEEIIAEKGYTIPEMEQIVFINTTMKEECDAMAYTHGTQIYIDGAALAKINKDGEESVKRLDYIFGQLR
jgi:cupin superfamily acireductone dioxygenase involved in methionine salvage